MYQRKKGYQQDLETAGDPQADGRELQKLVQLHYGEAELVRAVARNPACPSQLLLEFYRYAQAWTADNPKIAELLKDNDWRISALIAPREKYSRYGDPVNFHAPVVHKVLWVLEHGENDYKRLVLQLAGLSAEVLRTEAVHWQTRRHHRLPDARGPLVTERTKPKQKTWVRQTLRSCLPGRLMSIPMQKHSANWRSTQSPV